MPIDRSTLKIGPGAIFYNGAVIYFNSDITARLVREVANRESSSHGDIGGETLDRYFEVSGVPESIISYLSTLLPYASTKPGASLFGATDKTLVIHTFDGDIYTFQAAAITGPPTLTFAAGQNLIGSVTWMCIQKNNTALDDATGLLAVTSGAFTDTSFNSDDIVRQSYSAAWGASPWDALNSQGGFVVTPRLQAEPLSFDQTGRADMRFRSFKLAVRGIVPLASTSAQLTAQAIQGSGYQRGKALSGTDFVISGTGLTFTVKNAAIIEGGYMFGAFPLRDGELAWEGIRKVTANVQDAAFTIA